MASSAGSIDSWSDSEIRTKLAELGTPVGPVTETTRKILIKKLKRLLQLQNNNASSPAKQRRSLLRYSSEESQGEDVDMPPPTTKVKNLRRKTIGHTELSAASDNSVIDVSRSSVSERTTRNRKSVGSVTVPKESFDSDSDSDISLSALRSRSRKSLSVEKSTINTSRSTFQDVKVDSPKSINSLRRTSRFSPSSSRIPETKKYEEEEEEEEEEEQEDTEEEENTVKPPVFQSDFLTRLNAGRLSGSYRSSMSPKSDWKPSSSSYTQSYVSQRSIGSLDNKFPSSRYEHLFSTRPSTADGHTSLLNRPISTHSNITTKIRVNSLITRYEKIIKWVLGGIAVVGFIIAVYFLLHTNFSTIHLAAIDSDDNKYPVCGQEGVEPNLCVPDNQLKPALDISKVLIPRILELTTKAYCDPPDNNSLELPTMSEEEALKYLAKKMPSVTRPNLERDLRNFKILVMANPHWEVEVMGKGLTEINALLFNGDFAARRVDLPTVCYLRLMMYKLIKVLIFIGILVGSGFAVLFGARLYKREQDKHKQEVYSMVNKILNLLSAHHEQNTLPAYLAINNCRDELIPPSERDRKKRVWDDAVEFLEKHESRVRTEMHNIRGENVKVWRWLPAGGQTLSPNTSFDSSSGPVLGRLL
ncbi:Inner nuclear membrane protein Man1 [Gryllus bimaculatus]|nr:Inner nuclear membrane protein Man1 [Gryllus bimaculatus]